MTCVRDGASLRLLRLVKTHVIFDLLENGNGIQIRARRPLEKLQWAL